MGIASFSPSLSLSISNSKFCAPGLSVLLAPVHALVSLLMPVQPSKTSYRPAARAPAHLPQLRWIKPPETSRLTETSVAKSSLSPSTVRTTALSASYPVSRLKVMREFEPGKKCTHAGRMVISGRMADVCAELDRIALKESTNA